MPNVKGEIWYKLINSPVVLQCWELENLAQKTEFAKRQATNTNWLRNKTLCLSFVFLCANQLALAFCFAIWSTLYKMFLFSFLPAALGNVKEQGYWLFTPDRSFKIATISRHSMFFPLCFCVWKKRRGVLWRCTGISNNVGKQPSLFTQSPKPTIPTKCRTMFIYNMQEPHKNGALLGYEAVCRQELCTTLFYPWATGETASFHQDTDQTQTLMIWYSLFQTRLHLTHIKKKKDACKKYIY